MKMTDEKDTTFCHMLWGPYKTGKTVLASQYPNPHFVTLDPQALMSVRGLRAKFNLDFDVQTVNIDENETTDPDFLELVKMQKMATQPAWLKAKKLLRSWCKTLSGDDTVIIDNLSRAGEYIANYIQPGKKEKFGWDEWNKYINELEELQDILWDGTRKCSVIIIAHEEVREDDLTGDKKRYILIKTNKRHRLPSLVTDHLYLYNEIKGTRNERKVIRKLQTIPDDNTDAGSRCLIPDISFPTFAKMKPYLEQALGRELPPPNWTPPEDQQKTIEKE
jgi:hypothetical protein